MTRWRSALAGIGIAMLCVAAEAAGEAHWLHVARPGDTLIGLAGAYLERAQDWQRLQQINGVADPLHLMPGTRLRIPLALMRKDPVGAEVLRVNGPAERLDAAGARSVLAAGDALRVGERLRVGEGGNLTLRFPDGTRVLVLEKTTLSLGEAVRLRGTDAYRVRIDVHEGSIDSRVTPVAGSAGRYEVRTPALRMAVRGTEFRAAAVDGVSRGEVVGGQVAFEGARKRTLTLGAGFGTLAAAGEPPRPARPLPPAPDLGALPARVERLPLRFAWASPATTPRWRAQVLSEDGALLLDGIFTSGAAKWADLPDGPYRLRVRGIGDDGLEGLDGSHAFVLKARPEPPFGAGPGDKSWGDSAHFRWTQAASAVAYHFQLATDASFARPIADLTDLKGTDLTQALAPGSYFWRVASIARGGDHGPFGDALPLLQKPIPASPQMEAPEADEGQLKLRWRAGDPGQSYQVQMARSADFAVPVVDQRSAEPGIVLPRPEPGEYFLRVRAIDADGFAGPYGSAQTLRIEGGARWWLVPLLLLPFGI